jgi:hypothetical protein
MGTSMQPLPSAQPSGSADRLDAAVALRADSVLEMRQGWHALARESELPTTQFDWTVAGLDQLKAGAYPYVAYVSGGGNLRAILPLTIRSRMGIEHLCQLTPAIAIPTDVLHSDAPSLELLFKSVLKQGKPVILNRLLDGAPAAGYIRSLAGHRRVSVVIEKADSAMRLRVEDVPVQDRSQSSARVSILAASYGLSGGPNDVIFQFAAPTLEQVMSLYHELLQLDGTANHEGSGEKFGLGELDAQQFLKTHVYHGVQRGEMRFSCLRLGSVLLAAQLFQLRGQTAWLLKTVHQERFNGTIVDTLLIGETVHKLQDEGIQQIVMPARDTIKGMGMCEEMPTINVQLYPWGPRSWAAKMLGRFAGPQGR